jgi:hypothetical protein
MPENDKMYELICKERFDKMEEMQKETLELLKGKDDKPGLVEQVRNLRNRWKYIFAAVIFLVANLCLQVIEWVKCKLFT